MSTGKAMMILLLLVPLLALTTEVLGQHSGNSLQAAIEALHRHHEILSSQHARQHHDPSSPSSSLPSHRQAEDYFTDDNDYPYGENLQQQQQQGQLNRALVDYLAREGQREHIPARYPGPAAAVDFEDVEDEDELAGFEARKRSIFRERDDTPYKSVFREREQYAQPDLGQEFLEEMEREREEEEEDRYRDTLRRLWDKYQQQENSIERQLFEEQRQQTHEDSDAEGDDEDKRKRSFDLDDKRKKKQKRFGYIPMYIGPVPYKRRDYPLLPWLPAEDDRKKRFMVAKRSAKPIPQEANVSGTSDKVAKDLQTLFGAPPTEDDKKKRSTDEAVEAKLPKGTHKIEKKSDHSFADPEEEEEEDEEGHGEHEHEHEHEEEGHEHEEDDEHDDDEDEDKKKKRAIPDVVKSSPEIVKEDQIIPGDLAELKKKKSVHWDKFLAFGYDKRKKKSVDSVNGKYRSMIKRQLRQKKEVDPEKIDSMDDKLKSIEDLIIEETVKYTGAHEGASNPEEIQKIKDHVISRLATAYSLEKMRRALDQLRENVDTERHLQHNEIEPFKGDHGDDDEDEEDLEKKKKRVAAKKDRAEASHGHPEVEDEPGHRQNAEAPHDEHEDAEEEKKRKKKRKRNGMDFELDDNSLSQVLAPAGYLEQSDYASARQQCPLLNAMEKRCRGVDILSGDIHQELLPICAVHQLCYLCGTSQTSCDLQYLSDADSMCGGHNNKECEAAARSALMILRGAPGPQLGPRECARNSCLYNAIRDIAY